MNPGRLIRVVSPVIPADKEISDLTYNINTNHTNISGEHSTAEEWWGTNERFLSFRNSRSIWVIRYISTKAIVPDEVAIPPDRSFRSGRRVSGLSLSLTSRDLQKPDYILY